MTCWSGDLLQLPPAKKNVVGLRDILGKQARYSQSDLAPSCTSGPSALPTCNLPLSVQVLQVQLKTLPFFPSTSPSFNATKPTDATLDALPKSSNQGITIPWCILIAHVPITHSSSLTATHQKRDLTEPGLVSVVAFSDACCHLSLPPSSTLQNSQDGGQEETHG